MTIEKILKKKYPQLCNKDIDDIVRIYETTNVYALLNPVEFIRFIKITRIDEIDMMQYAYSWIAYDQPCVINIM